MIKWPFQGIHVPTRVKCTKESLSLTFSLTYTHSLLALSLHKLLLLYKCDPLWKNRPLAIFHENHVLGIGRRRIYCRVQRSKSQALKSFLSRVMAKKLYTGYPCLSSQFFKKRSILYVHSSTFNVSVYAPYYTTRLAP